MHFPKLFENILDGLQTVPASMWVTAGGAGIIAFAAGLAFSRGALQQLLNMVSLILGVGAAWFVFSNRSDVFGSAGVHLQSDRLMICAGIAGLVTYIASRAAVRLLAGMGILRLVGSLAGWKGVIISAIPSSFLLWLATSSLRLVGDVHRLETAALVAKQGAMTPTPTQQASAWDRLSRQMDRSTIGALVAKIDPFDMRSAANLARLLILWPDGSVWKKLAQDSKTRSVLNHDRIQKLGKDPKVRACIEKKDFPGLIHLPQVVEAAGHPDLKPVLTGLALEDAMDSIIYKKPEKKPVVAKR